MPLPWSRDYQKTISPLKKDYCSGSITLRIGQNNSETILIGILNKKRSTTKVVNQCTAKSIDGMKEISYEDAVNIFLHGNQEVCLMYDDGTEALVVNQVEIYDHHQNGGKFGLEI
jgi:hypothetical protein